MALEPLNTFGSGGSGAGQLNFAGGGLAVDDTGNVFVPESNNRRVSKFDRTGGVPRAFGYDVIPGPPEGFETCTAVTGCQAGDAGDAPGQIGSATGATIGANGHLFVVDNSRVNEFTTQGAFVRAFGYNVRPGDPVTFETCTAATGCKAGDTPGGNPGQLRFPEHIAADAAGNLFVADNGNHRISQFTVQGSFVRAFGHDVIPGGGTGFEVCTAAPPGCKTGTIGGAAGQLSFPIGVGIGANGNLFVGDSANHRISQFTPQGAFVRAFGFGVVPGEPPTEFNVCTAGTNCQAGTVGSEAGQLAEPEGVAGDAAGNLFVADTSINQETVNHRISQFTVQGSFVRAFGHDVIPGNLNVGFEVCTAGTGCKAGTEGVNLGQLSFPQGVATDCRGAIYTVEFTRVQRFGEAGTQLPPCPSGGPGPPEGPDPPSNEFSFGTVKKNKKRGTAKLTVIVPGAGSLELAGKRLKGDVEQVEAAASGAGAGGIEAKLAVKAKGKAKRALKRRGKAKVKPEITYTPDGGEPRTQSTSVKLKRRT